MVRSLWVLLMLVALGTAWSDAQACRPGTDADSNVYGYTASYLVPGSSTPCTTTFKTLEEAEYAIRHDPSVDGYVLAELAFVVGTDFFTSQTQPAQLDYRPNGAAHSGASVLQGPPLTMQTGYSLYLGGWPPTPATVRAECLSHLQGCVVGGGMPAGWCPSIATEVALAQCQFDGTWDTNPNYCWTRQGGATSPGEVTELTSVSVSPSNPSQGTLRYVPDSSIDIGWDAKMQVSAERCGNVEIAGEVDEVDETRTFDWNLQRQDNITCPQGEKVNSGASGSDNACGVPLFKELVEGPPFQQDPQCGVGNPCVPGNGNKTAHETGFRHGYIALDLYYNSLRQLRPYSYIDRNWSHSFAKRVLTQWSQDHLAGAEPEGAISNLQTVFVQSEQAQLEVFKRVHSSTPGVFRSTYSVGNILRYFAPPEVVAPQWHLARSDGTVEVFDRAGRMVAVIHPDDPRRDLALDYLLPGQMDDPTVTLATDLDHLQETFWRVSQVASGDGRYVAFHYVDPQFLWLSSIVADDGTSLMQFGYDAQHRLTSVALPGGTRQFLYNEPAHISPLIPADVTGYWLTGIVDEEGRRYATYEYDDWGRATASWHGVDAGKVTIQYPLDAQGDPDDTTAIATMPLGGTRTYTYGVGSQSQPYRQPDEVVESPGSGQPDEAMATTYDTATRRVASRTDGRGAVTKYFYETSSALLGVHEIRRIEAFGTAEQRRIETDWDAGSNRVLERRVYSDPTNSGTGTQETEVSYGYDPTSSRLVTRTQTDPATGESRAWTYEYCTSVNSGNGCAMIGLLHSIDGPRTDVSDATTFSYYPSTDVSGCASGPGGACHRIGDLHKVTNALGHVTESVSYDRAGRVTRMKDANGTITDFVYHARGWLTQRIVRASANGSPGAGDAVLRIDRDAAGNATKVTLPDGAYLAYTYDAAGRILRIRDNQNNVIDYCPGGEGTATCLDKAGNRVIEQIKDPAGVVKRTMRRQYDQLSRLTRILNAASQPVFDATNGYDENDNLTLSADGLGMATGQTYDPLNRLIQTLQDANGPIAATRNATTTYVYDARDNLRQVTDPDGLTTQYEYDGFDDLRDLVSPDTGASGYEYDKAGNRVAQIDNRGVVVIHAYDALNRLSAITYPDTTLNVAYAYDQPNNVTGCPTSWPVGRLTRMTDASGTTTWCYDRRGNVTRKVQVSGSVTMTTATTYTLADRVATITYPSGAAVAYARDSTGRVTSVSWKANASAPPVTLISQATYYPFGPIGSLTYGNGRTMSRSHDTDYAIGAITSSASGGLTLDFDVDVMGNITASSDAVNQATPDRTYVHDRLYRLSKVFEGSPTRIPLEAYTYSKTGDRLSASASGTATAYAYAPGTHHLASVGGVARSYDANGNLLSLSDTPYPLVYDDRNRLVQAKYDGPGGYALHDYTYNGKGERVAKQTPDRRATSAYDEAGHLLSVYTTSAGGGGSLVGPSFPAWDEVIYLDNLPVGLARDGVLYYVEADHLGTPRQVIDRSSNVAIWKWSLLGNTFGANAPDEDPDGNGNAFEMNLRFPGQYFDQETGLHYNYFRDYEPGTGRYVESDPIGLSGGINTFAYASGNSLYLTDRLGLAACGKDCCKNIQWPTRAGDFAAGTVSCCGGDAVVCTNPRICEGVDTSGKTFAYPKDACTVVTGCVKQHERFHKRRHVSCSGKSDGPAPFEPPFAGGRGECEAYRDEIPCLNISKCTSNLCVQIVRQIQEHKKTKRDSNCAAAGM